MYQHISVLLNESIEALNIKEDGIYVDMTCGGAGHSSKILEKLTTGHLYAFDQDLYAIQRSTEVLSKIGNNFTLINANFSHVKEELNKLGIEKVDGILYDLGVSSFQLDIPDRGFSYNEDALLDMRMDNTKGITAKDIVNTYSYNDLVRIFYKYGEEPFSKQIAKKICLVREEKEINTTFELVDIIKSSLPQKVLKQKGHPAKLIFQALRIEVNKELEVLESSIKQAIDLINVDGSVVVITFQPLEDKIVKHAFKEASTINIPIGVPVRNIDEAPYKMLKPKLPTQEEMEYNHRSHSARLRVLKRIK